MYYKHVADRARMMEGEEVQLDLSKMVTGVTELTTKVGFLWLIKCIVAIASSKCASLVR